MVEIKLLLLYNSLDFNVGVVFVLNIDLNVEVGSIPYLIGQGFGILAIILGFVSYQLKTQKQVLFCQAVVGAVFLVHYALIGAVSGMAMNVISLIRNTIYAVRGGKNDTRFDKAIPIVFTVLMGIMGILSWTNWYSIFVFLGLVINSYCMSFSDPQMIRKSILITSPLVLIYDIFALSIGGAVYESVAVISSVIGIIRMKKDK